MKTLRFLPAFILICLLPSYAEDQISPGDRMLAEYLATETARIESKALAGLESKEDWPDWKEARRGELFSMLGLAPDRARTELKPTITGATERDGIVVENLHFQSSPGLYVTANLYRPSEIRGKLPAVLYVCGHGRVKKGDVSFGNKVHYHHHGAWFARNGYVCLIIDTLQLGEIEGIHHGTYRYGRWDWVCRGYSPAAVEAWNSIRALDYLESRDEVDASRLGVTGRSGGGAYSWYLTALDDRIKVSVPVAGITSLHDHVVGRCVDGHCDCMYMVNHARWDFAHLSALAAPRPLLIQNTDKDPIFPLEGVVDVHQKTREIYRLLGAANNLGLCITDGPHKDTQELRVPAFRWFERHLKGTDSASVIRDQAEKMFEPEELKVFKALPEDQINTDISNRFTNIASAPVIPEMAEEFARENKAALERLRSECFAAWPKEPGKNIETELAFDHSEEGVRLRAFDFTSQAPFNLRLFVAHRDDLKLSELDLIVLNVLDEQTWKDFTTEYGTRFSDQLGLDESAEFDKEAFALSSRMLKNFKWGMAYTAPRGVGPTEWTASEKRHHQVRRSFVLLGQTVDGMRVWDARMAMKALRSIDGAESLPLWLQSSGSMAGVTLYASLFEEDITRLDLHNPPASHREGTTLINVLRVWDMPSAVASAAAKSKVAIYDDSKENWQFPVKVSEKLDWEKGQIQIRDIPAED